MNTFYMPGIVLSALYALFHFIVTISLWVRQYYFSNSQILQIRELEYKGFKGLT